MIGFVKEFVWLVKAGVRVAKWARDLEEPLS